MVIYILKFSACLALFLAFYKLFLEKENMHVFKRFYLLGALLLAIGIPLVTFTYYVEPIAQVLPLVIQEIPVDYSTGLVAPETNYLPIILWSIYSLGVMIFGFKFIRNLYGISYKIKHNPKQKTNRITNVLLQDLIVPHTFFNFIFFNKQKFEAQEIPKEVLLHEETHAKQKHSIDVIFIEVLQVLFWFNPLLYIIKHLIKLNHEFLADQGVINKGIETATYQQTLLAFSSNGVQPQLASAINYSLIKKRFTVMKTQTSKRAIWFRSLVLLPLLAITLYSFSNKIEVEKELSLETLELSQAASPEQQKATKAQVKEYNKLAKKYNDMPKDNMVIKSSDLERLKYLYHLMSDKQKSNAESFPNIPAPPAPQSLKAVSPNSPPPPPIPANATEAQKRKYKEAQRAYREEIKIKNIKEQKTKLIRVREIRSVENRKKLEQEKLVYRETQVAARTLNLIAQKEQRVQVRELRSVENRKKLEQEKLVYRETQVAARTLKLKAQKEQRIQVREIRSVEDRKKLEQEKLAYRKTQVAARTLKLKAQKEQRVQVREIRLVNDRKKLEQEKIVYREAQVAARVLKVKASKERRIRLKEVMPPPPPLPPNATPEQKRKYEEAIKKYKRSRSLKSKDGKTLKIKDVPPPPPIPASASPEEKIRMQKVSESYYDKLENGEIIEIVEVPEVVEIVEVEPIEVEEIMEAPGVVEVIEVLPPPPPPKSPLEHIKDMAKKGAEFYYDGKSISSSKAIKLIRSNKNMSIMTNHTSDTDFVVTLSTKPIVIED